MVSLLFAAVFVLDALGMPRRGLLHGGRRCGCRHGSGVGGSAEYGGGRGQVGVLLQPLQEHVEHGDLPEGLALALHGLEGRRVAVVILILVLLLLLLLPPPRMLPDAGLFPVDRLLVDLKGGWLALKMTEQRAHSIVFVVDCMIVIYLDIP